MRRGFFLVGMETMVAPVVGSAMRCAFVGAVVAVGGGAAAQAPLTVDVVANPITPVYVPSPTQTRAPDPTEILGIRIERNGALITGPMDARRTYIPLDRPMIPDAMRGHWARSAEACIAPPTGTANDGQAAAKDNVMITHQMILAKQPMQILQTYVLPPSHISFALLQSGKPMMLRARQHKKAEEILVIFSLKNGTRDYAVMRLSPDKRSITLQNQNSAETAVRCDS